MDLAYLLVICYIMWMLGEMFGRGSIWGYRFDGEIHRQEAANAILYQEEEVQSTIQLLSSLYQGRNHNWLRLLLSVRVPVDQGCTALLPSFPSNRRRPWR